MNIGILGFISVGNTTLNAGGCISWAVAGLLAGWLAGLLARGRGFGCLGDILLGLVGAVVGLFLLNLVGFSLPPELGFWGTTLVAFVGAFILALIGRLLGGSGRHRSYPDWRYRRQP
ncbi:MAG TPA: GlsB/YeaQ/YmgE family stress response membrane protein [Ktedonobacterales bacterium]|jgi:uncharacterized membrane protein YeaQ/YmgE (transglycosylase-associated protein family)|nr:GlsB/YeaQ/YmgE family stress response membrane protein [Ktedonobacterales bacterium]